MVLKTKESTLLNGSMNFWVLLFEVKDASGYRKYIGFYIDVPLCMTKDEWSRVQTKMLIS